MSFFMSFFFQSNVTGRNLFIIFNPFVKSLIFVLYFLDEVLLNEVAVTVLFTVIAPSNSEVPNQSNFPSF